MAEINKDSETSTEIQPDKFSLRDLRTFDLGFWILCADCMLQCAINYTTIDVSNGTLVSRYNFSQT